MPRDTLACLQALEWPIHFIHGNGDRVLAAVLAGDDITEVPEAFRDTIAWTAQQLDANQRARGMRGLAAHRAGALPVSSATR